MRIFLASMILASSLAMAQGPSFTNNQLTTGVVGITPGQTARLNVVYPTAPAPIAQILCSATLAIGDEQGVLKSNSVTQFVAGKTVSLDVNGDTDLGGRQRVEIHGFSIAPNGCRFVTSLEVIDNATQKTLLVVGSKTTYPFTPTPAPAATAPPLATIQPQQ